MTSHKKPCGQTKVGKLKDFFLSNFAKFSSIYSDMSSYNEKNTISDGCSTVDWIGLTVQECQNVEALWSNKSGQADIL